MMSDQDRLDGRSSMVGRRVVVTGGSSGIGKETARWCVAHGATVAIMARRRGPLVEAAAETGARAVAADVRDPQAVVEAMSAAADALQGIDGLVCAAGLMLHSPLKQARYEDWRAMVDVNILGILHTVSAAMPHLEREPFADIVNVGSVAADGASRPDYTLYAATKAALRTITTGLSAEFEDGDIRVVEIAPGLISDGGFGPGIRDESLREEVDQARHQRGMPASRIAERIGSLLLLPRDVRVSRLDVLPSV